jgi:hypothetical protein
LETINFRQITIWVFRDASPCNLNIITEISEAIDSIGRRAFPPRQRYPFATLGSATYQRTIILIFIAGEKNTRLHIITGYFSKLVVKSIR